MDGVCRVLRSSAEYVRNWIEKQPSVKEESLTDWMLFDTSTRVPNIHYRAFTRHEEARKTGADWEWWFVFPTMSFRFRVQAKKLSPTHDNYSEIARTNRYGLQIDKLLNDSKTENAIPLYAFYSALTAPLMCGGVGNGEGVFLAGGQRVFDAVISGSRKKVTAPDMLLLSNPFSCFACCPLSIQSGDLSDFLRNYYQSELATQSENTDEMRGVYDKPPTYVSSLLEAGKETLPVWWDAEFSFQLHNFNALLVYDFRNPHALQRAALI